MFKEEAQKILKTTKLEKQEIEVNGKILKVGDTKISSRGNLDSFTANESAVQITTFASPQAHGYTGKWDDAKDTPAIILQRNNCHPSNEFEIRIAWDF